MKLFNDSIDQSLNLLPKNGIVNYYGKVFPEELADAIFSTLMEKLDWKNDEAIVYGKHHVIKRKVAWYGTEQFQYKYAGILREAMPFNKELSKLKEFVELQTNERYNSCLCNLYHNGDESMGWHSDNEKELKKNGAIASLSFGAERNFAFKHKTSNEKLNFLLEHGSLLVMKGEIQDYWLHRLPPSKKVTSARINLTFRTISNTK